MATGTTFMWIEGLRKIFTNMSYNVPANLVIWGKY
jgi:hypothetical protein